MAKITLLPDILIDQIAAGEVLENPASAVKELVENSIDAGAKEIVVSIEGGGLQRIEVEDDGSGMDKEDLALCLCRHATSKICSLEDLQKIASKGFRGEALATIAAVSKTEVRTSVGASFAWKLADGKILPCARGKGTSIEIWSLFQNTPARLKFQKSPSACASSILKTIEILSLPHPEVKFRLISNGKEILKLLSTSWEERALEIVGPMAHRLNGVQVQGLIGSPEEAKGNRSGQYLFVNNRPVLSHLVAKAVKEGFGTRIEEKLFPTFVLFLNIPPSHVDVNVHPQKKEVRFLEEGKIYSMVRREIAKVFEDQIPLLKPLPWDFVEVKPTIHAYSAFEATLEPRQMAEPINLAIEPPFRVIGLMEDFLLLEEEGWKLVDLRGALARVLFEEIEEKAVLSEPLLFPFELDVLQPEEVCELIGKMGIEARAISKTKIGIFAIPVGLEMQDVERLILDRKEKNIAQAIVKALRSSKKLFQIDEAKNIWKRLQKCKDRIYDPLGKKITAYLTKEELRRFF